MTAVWPGSLVLAGAGKMGGALLRGWIAGGMPGPSIRVVDPYLDEDTRTFCVAEGVVVEPATGVPEVLVLAIKPQTFSQSPDLYTPLVGSDTLVISILAGKTLANLRAGLPNAGAIVRAMPNLPASVGRGASGLAGEPGHLSSHQQTIATGLLGAVGHVEWLDESLIDAVTAVSGSGPAYVFFLAECLAEAGVATGLPADVALRLARATVEGAGALMARQSDRTPSQLREAVTSPGGTTAAALDILRAELPTLMTKAVTAAKKRAGKLAG